MWRVDEGKQEGTLRTVKDTDSAVLDTVEDVLDGTFLPTEDVDVEGVSMELVHVGDMGGLIEEELEGKAGDVLGMLVEQRRDDFPSDKAAAGDDTSLQDQASKAVSMDSRGGEMKTHCVDASTLCSRDLRVGMSKFGDQKREVKFAVGSTNRGGRRAVMKRSA